MSTHFNAFPLNPQAPPPPYYTVGMDNKGMDGSMDTGLDDPSKTAIYSSQQYHNYSQNGHINNTPNNNGECTPELPKDR